jgi:hypothetical protein
MPLRLAMVVVMAVVVVVMVVMAVVVVMVVMAVVVVMVVPMIVYLLSRHQRQHHRRPCWVRAICDRKFPFREECEQFIPVNLRHLDPVCIKDSNIITKKVVTLDISNYISVAINQEL